MKSDFIDVDEFMVFATSDTAAKSSQPSETGVVIIPRDLDIDFKAEVKKTSFKGLVIKDLKGEIDLKEGILVLTDAALNLIDCKVSMNATYGSVTPVKGFFDFQICRRSISNPRSMTIPSRSSSSSSR